MEISGEVGMLRELQNFIRELGEGKVTCVSTRAQDRARQVACKNGLVTFDRKNNRPRGSGWKLTNMGQALLADGCGRIEGAKLVWNLVLRKLREST